MTIDPRASRGKRLALALAIILCGLPAWSGCSDNIPAPAVVISRKPVKVDAVPEAILKVAKRTLRGVNFEEAWSNHDKDGSTIGYELRGTTPEGKIRDVRLDQAGKVLETE